MPLCGILNPSSGSSWRSFSNCVRAFVQPSVIFHECVHSSNSLEFYVGICNELPEFCLMQLAIACFVNFLRGLLTQAVVLVIPRSAIATLWCSWVKVPFLHFWSRSPKNCTKRRSLHDANSSECYFWSSRGISCLANSSTSSLLLTTFTKHSFSIDWYTMRRCCLPNSFSRRGHVNSVHCILFSASMNLVIHLPRFFVSVICSLHWHCGRHKLHTHPS